MWNHHAPKATSQQVDNLFAEKSFAEPRKINCATFTVVWRPSSGTVRPIGGRRTYSPIGTEGSRWVINYED